MTLVRTLLGIDLLVALVVVYFFVAGFADGSVSSFNMSLWLGLLAAVAAAIGGGWVLKTNGQRGLAITLLSNPGCAGRPLRPLRTADGDRAAALELRLSSITDRQAGINNSKIRKRGGDRPCNTCAARHTILRRNAA
jgi:hypothetical protein